MDLRSPLRHVLFILLLAFLVTGKKLRVKRQTKPTEVIPIISFENIQNEDGSYKFSYVTGNGISVSEEGRPKNLTSGEGKNATQAVGMTAQGSYSYLSPEGGEVSVVWTADEGGFRPKVTFRPRDRKDSTTI